MSIIVKRSDEADDYAFDFRRRPRIVAGDTIASVVGITVTPSGLTVGTTTISGTKVIARISGGSDGTDYLLECEVTTTAGATLVCPMPMRVSDKPDGTVE